MKKHQFFPFYSSLILLLLIVFSCSQRTTASPEKGLDKTALIFTLEPYSNYGIHITGTLGIVPQTSEGTLVLAIKNGSNSSISIQTSLLTLKSDSGYENLPYKSSVSELTLKKGASKTITLNYAIINNPFLYQRYGLAGDIRNKYWITDDFINFNNKSPSDSRTIQCIISEDVYQSYLKEYGIEKDITTYETGISNGAFLQQQGQYLKQHKLLMTEHHDDENTQNEKPEEPAVLLSGDEIVLNQLICKFSPYKIKDTYYLSIKIINRYPDPIQIDSSKFTILVGTSASNNENKTEVWVSQALDFTTIKQNYSPLNERTGKEVLVLQQNDRVNMTFSFRKTNTTNTKDTVIYIIADGLTMYKQEIPLIGIPLLYKKGAN